MEMMAARSLSDFINSMVEQLRCEYEEELQSSDDASLREMVAQGIESAESYGIDESDDVEVYLKFMVEYGPDFDEKFDWAREVLSSSDDGSSKIEALLKREPENP